ncbi:hypothetical protein PNOK_0718000 [Pyrrhoderma noxium]|uniref:Uncharacterized protein n=1 Tax=Pyrrhoderma noxium TaxID=2282107 RepID=A0A286UC33_9AGAM|nr:hypothetical protein PNOK_0718000 [Pyrrhoderma noxium]
MDICTVALGIRAGYLLDTFAPVQGESTLYRLLIQLQQTTTAFDDVRIVYSKKAQQYFFININLLKRLLATLDRDASTTQDSSNTNTKFVLLTEHVQIIPPPHEVITAAKHIAEATTATSSSSNSKEPLTIPLPEDLSTSSLIALAGFLLEYPVVYVPPSPSHDRDYDLERDHDHDQDQYQTTSLNGVPLDLYQYTLVRNSNSNSNIKSRPKEQETHNTHTHTLLKFSSIASLSTTNPSLKPEHMIKSLDLLFRDRLSGVGIGIGIETGIGSSGGISKSRILWS